MSGCDLPARARRAANWGYSNPEGTPTPPRDVAGTARNAAHGLLRSTPASTALFGPLLDKDTKLCSGMYQYQDYCPYEADETVGEKTYCDLLCTYMSVTLPYFRCLEPRFADTEMPAIAIIAFPRCRKYVSIWNIHFLLYNLSQERPCAAQ